MNVGLFRAEGPHIHTKEPYPHTKKPYIHTKEPYLHIKEPNVHTKEPYIHTKERGYVGAQCGAIGKSATLGMWHSFVGEQIPFALPQKKCGTLLWESKRAPHSHTFSQKSPSQEEIGTRRDLEC